MDLSTAVFRLFNPLPSHESILLEVDQASMLAQIRTARGHCESAFALPHRLRRRKLNILLDKSGWSKDSRRRERQQTPITRGRQKALGFRNQLALGFSR